MGIADSMKAITEDIIASYDVRVKALGDLVADTRKTLKGFASNRKKMSAEQAGNLADFVQNLSKSVGDMLKSFQKNHKQMSDAQAKSLADFVKGLANDVGSMLGGFQKDRGKMSKELKDKLAKEVKEIETYVKKRLKDFSNAHAEMSEALKKSLAKYVGEIVSGVKKLLGDYGSDMKKAKDDWKSMSATLAKKRGGKPVKVEAGGGVKIVEEVLKKKAKKKAAKEEVEEEGPAGEILSILEDYPDGATLTEIADEMGVHFASIIKPMGELVDEGKVEKVDNRYLLA